MVLRFEVVLFELADGAGKDLEGGGNGIANRFPEVAELIACKQRKGTSFSDLVRTLPCIHHTQFS
jgi:hypothetical protein